MLELFNSDVFILFLIISLGKLVEQIKIRNFSLGIASIFFIAAIFGYNGYQIDPSYQLFGLSLFIYCIGIEAGPQFFSSFNKKGFEWGFITLLHLFLSILIIISIKIFFRNNISDLNLIGLFSGSIICTPAMTAVLEVIKNNELTTSFALIYPFSLIGNIYLIPLLPKIFRHNIEYYKKEYIDKNNLNVKRIVKMYKITNPNIIGKPISAIKKLINESIVISRYIENSESILAEDDLILKKDGCLVAVGYEDELKDLEILIGNEEKMPVMEPKNLHTKRIIISNRKVAGKTMGELDLENIYNVKITRILRSGIEFSPTNERQLLLGDRIVAFGNSEDINKLMKFLGDDLEEIFKTPFAPISLGIVLGFIFGKIPLPIINNPLGITAGILLISMILGYKVKLFGILWQIPQQTNSFLKQLSLYIFFAVIGTNSGKDLVETLLYKSGSLMLILGILLIILPTVIIYIFSTYILKKNPLEIIGLLAGNVNNSSVIAAINDNYKTDISNAPFAFSYPFALIAGIIFTQLLIPILRLL